MNEHEEFVQLCAFYTLGGLSEQQLKRLDDHLKKCVDCRQALQEFQEIASMGLPALAPELADLPEHGDSGIASERVHQRLLARIYNEVLSRAPNLTGAGAPVEQRRKSPARLLRSSRIAPFLAMGLAALLLMVVSSLYTYHLGSATVASRTQPKLEQSQANLYNLNRKLNDLNHRYNLLTATLQTSDKSIQLLTVQLQNRQKEIVSLQDQKNELSAAVSDAEARSAVSKAERLSLDHKLADATSSLAALQNRLAAETAHRDVQVRQVATLKSQLSQASGMLRDRERTIAQQRRLLAYDRDIRDLISARNLYVAEVTDVGSNAEDEKPFGRVFFTKNKSLIFYAYDLDRQPGVRRASAFQVWGRRGPDFSDALPLGMMYLDNSSKRRWVLRFDNPGKLADINAVFITVEPKGGSKRPTGKPLLFAYLKVEPNHAY